MGLNKNEMIVLTGKAYDNFRSFIEQHYPGVSYLEAAGVLQTMSQLLVSDSQRLQYSLSPGRDPSVVSAEKELESIAVEPVMPSLP